MNNQTDKKEIVVSVSGGFDPIHPGHIRLFKEAKSLGDKLVVILNNDNWLRLKKGFVFMSENERKEILMAIAEVDDVYITQHEPNTAKIDCCDAIAAVKPDIFCNGGDRHQREVPEAKTCREIGCEMIDNVGDGGKIASSSELVRNAMAQISQLS